MVTMFLGPDHAYGPPFDVSADDVEHQVNAADVFQHVVPRSTNSIAPKSSVF